MAESLKKLAEALCLHQNDNAKSSSDLVRNLRSDDSVRPGLETLYQILDRGVSPSEAGELGLQSWSDSQIQELSALASAIAQASRSLAVEQVDAVVLAVVQKSVEFAACYLEKTEYSGDDLSTQNHVVQLLETALIDGTNKFHEPVQISSVNSLLDSSLVGTGNSGDVEIDNRIKSSLQERASCLRDEKVVDRIYMTLASECIQSDRQATGSSEPVSPLDLRKLVFLSQYWAVSHVGVIRRLILVCRELVAVPDTFDEKMAGTSFRKKLAFGLRVLKLLGSVTKDVPYIEYDSSLVQAVASFADVLPHLFRPGFEFGNFNVGVEGSFEGLALSLMEEFLELARGIFCNSNIFMNIQACTVASVLDNLDSSVWRCSKASTKAPLAYFPRSVIYMIKIVHEIKRQTSRALSWKELNSVVTGDDIDTIIDVPSCHVHSEKVNLLKNYKFEQLLEMIFPSSNQWLDNLMHVVVFLHSEGVKLKAKVEKSYSIAAKAICNSEPETAVCHEDEALFGDLFSESGRSVGSVDGNDQLPVAVSSSYSNLPFEAAIEVLSFLKVCVFSPEWHHSLFEDGCLKLNRTHLDILLSLLQFQSYTDDRASDNYYHSQEDKVISRVHEICYQLLQDLVTRHTLPDSLEEYLLEKILIIENDAFVYTDQTLSLLAHTLFSRVGTAGSKVRAQVFKSYVDFIAEKANAVRSKCPSLKDLLGGLPSLFHIEILLMAFHLSSAEEKATLANLVFSSLREMDSPSSDANSSQLSCWALLVSRLILVLRHMICYPRTCPSSLLMHLRSKLMAFPQFSSGLPNCVDVHMASWASTTVKNVMGTTIEEDPQISCLINQLIDVCDDNYSVSTDDLGSDCLSLSRNYVASTVLHIIGFWKGQRALGVEDLIIERYVFLLCWDISAMAVPEEDISLWKDLQTLDTSNMAHFFFFTHAIHSHYDALQKFGNFSEVLLRLLQQLSAEPEPDNAEELGWDFLRNGMWLSLILSLLNAGFLRYGMKNAVPGVCLFWKNEDSGFDTVAEGLVSSIIAGGKVPMLLREFSSLLNRYRYIQQKYFLSAFDNSENGADCFSDLLLLKHSGIERGILDEIGKVHGNFSQVESVFDLLSKLDSILDKRGSRECLLHGFPLNLHVPTGIFLSSVLSVKGIISVLDKLVKREDTKENVFVDLELVSLILDSVMAVKSDRIFESIYEKCDAIFQTLVGEFGGSEYSDLYLLSHLEAFLRDISARGVSNSSVHECIITKAINTMDSLKRNPSKLAVLQFYLGIEDGSEKLKVLFDMHRGDLLVLMDSLDNCYSEPVNLKVLNFFIDLLTGELFPHLRPKVEDKFLGMNSLRLSKWLEARLLGSITETSDGISTGKGCSVSLRETTMSFILCLVSSPYESQSSELQSHIFEAALGSFDLAFLYFDIHTSRSFFHFIVQLSKGENSMRLLLKKTVTLMDKLAGDERLLPGLKFLFGFLGTIMSDSNSGKSISERSRESSLSGDVLRVGPITSRPAGSRKNSETLLLSANEEGGSLTLECDGTSVDEDEDDGTSDGEVASLDKDEEDDNNSERTLASKVCTFTSSGSNFMEQHWYFCYTCDLTVSKGCCSVCAKVCHRGHRVVYSRSSRFFCDCGAGGVSGSNCQCLKPRKFTGSTSPPARNASNFQSFLPFPEDSDQLPDSDSDVEEDSSTEVDIPTRLHIQKGLQDGIQSLLEELDFESLVLRLCSLLLPSITSKRDYTLSNDNIISLGKDKVLSFGVDLLQLKKAYKSGSLDLKIKADYSNAKELKSHLASGSLVKSLLSVSARGRLAVGEGDKVAVFDVGQLIGQATIAPVTADKTNVKPLSKNVVRFEIVHLSFNSVVENYLVVAGYEDCQVLTLNPRGEVTDRLAIELALQGSYIRRVDWVPGSQVQLMVVTNKFVKIFDLSQDNISPVHYFTLPDDTIVDATLFMAQRKMFLIVLSEQGSLYKLELAVEGSGGATPLTERLEIQGRDVDAKGSSLYFSSTYKLLFVSYQDGTTLVGRLSAKATSLTESSTVLEQEHDDKMRAAGLHRWKELLPGSGLFVCFSSLKSSSVLAISMAADEFYAQNIRHTVGSTSNLVGVTAYKPLSKDKIHCLVLHDDGSLQIYSHVPVGVDAAANFTAEKVKKLGSNILSNKAYAGLNPEFPLDFFERTMCITSDVKLDGDAIRNGDTEGAKQSLASEDGYLESPSPAGFKISVFNSNPDVVMVGFRLHVGNTSANHIPSEITISQRVIKLDEGMRSWYDVPFTVAESLLADEEFSISVGPTFNGSALPRIDSLEVYGRAKDEFGWKEKLDAVLDMEDRVLGCNSLLSGSSRKRRSMQSALVQEQVISYGLKLLSEIYSLRKLSGCSKVDEVQSELSKLNCKQLLEKIYESDREPSLQAAASRVLQAVFPKKEIYYHVKDSMRLLGVVKSTSVLSSRLGAGGIAGASLVEEFTAQMRAVSKIAVHRRSNLATFLEINGSEVVDGLMQVLWGILDFEQPDTQTMNNIVVSSVELIYCYAECLSLHGKDPGSHTVAPAVAFFRKLLFYPNEAVQTSSSLAISSRLLQVPFPKQTMLSTDDATESVVSASRPSEASSGGHVQVMNEEDAINSLVQYCCDGCSTVPILRRRWHCSICPDFDLCEACYEVPDADRLPPTHSRDHPMTAIPIEVESLGGEGNEFHFTPDDNMLPSLADSAIQNSAPAIHVLEGTESGEFSAPVSDTVSISASKRAVNSLLLSELLEQLKGWMQSTSGVRAIPVMQLFYRLSSAVGGPFIDVSSSGSLDLEHVIKWFLVEIDLNKPFNAKARSSFGEIAILVFMFFTLMLRNWHQPGSDGSTLKSASDTHDRSVGRVLSSNAPSSSDDQEKNDFASQLNRACNSLRQQPFANFLMDILQQLVQVFKSPAANHETGSAGSCGALLTVRRDLPAGNFSPFFSDSYAKAHRVDIFSDYHRLLLENTFRLVYTLIRPEKQDKSVEKEKAIKVSSLKDIKLEGYQDVLCNYINNANTNFVRRYARRLFLHICGSKSHYYSVRDSWQFSSETKKLFKHVNKSGGLHNPMTYERSVKIVRSLSTMAEVAASRPRNWQKYCLRHGDVLATLMNGIFYLGEESVIQTLKLLNLAFFTGKDIGNSTPKTDTVDAGISSNKTSSQLLDPKKKKKGEDGSELSSEKPYVDMESAVDIFTDRSGSVLLEFIDYFLLEWNSSSIRSEARSVLYGVWHHAKQSFRETMLASLLQKVKSLPMYGQNIVEYTELVTWLLGKAPDVSLKQNNGETVDRCLTSDVIRSISETLHSQNELLANHPNSRIYNTLSGLVEFDGYYLESEPCVSCSSPEVPYSRMKLESLKSETKFTDNRIIVKCTGSYTIQTVTMNVHDARKSKSVKVLNLYYNNRPVADLSELKNNWALWKRAKSCHLAFNQTELKVDFSIPITACNFMIELDSFYENLQALSLEPLQCPRCSRPVTDKHGICSNCHENAYQCRQCRNINYENLDSFLCNECGYSKYGRFEFNFTAKPSFSFDNMENDEDMKKGLAAIESESENAHRRYQQLLGFKKPLLKIVSGIGENEIDSQQKDSVQQMMVSLPGPSCKVNRKIALLGVLYGEKCKAAFDSVSKSVQTLQGLRRVLMNYLHQKNSHDGVASSRFVVSRSPNNCFGCASTFVTQCLEILQVLSKHPNSKRQLVESGILSELFENNIHQGPKTARVQARTVLCAFSEGDVNAVTELNSLVQKKVLYCLEHHRSMDIALATREEMSLLSEVCALTDEFWESRLRVVFQLLFSSIKLGAKHPAVSEHVILPCLRIISQACTPPKTDGVEKESSSGRSSSSVSQIKEESNSNISGVVGGNKPIPESEKNWDPSQKSRDIQLLSYSEWEKGASYLDFVRRQYKVSQAVKGGNQRSRQQRQDFLALKYGLRWKRSVNKSTKSELSVFELGSWVTELVLSACSQSIRSEMCMLISLLCAQSPSRRFQLLNLLVSLLPATLAAGESAAEYFDLLFKMIESDDSRLFLTVRGCLRTICKLITQEVGSVESLERSLRIDISQGFLLHKLIELLGNFLEVPNIRSRFMRDNLLSEILEALIVIRGLIVQKTKLISDCNRLLKDLLDGLLLENSENKRQFIKACISGLQIHGQERKGRTCMFILEQLCNLICPSKPEPVYLLVLNKAQTQEEFIRGSMTKNPYSSAEIGPLMRDVKNKICHQLDLLGLVEDDYGMELLVAGNIISLDLTVALVYEQVWKKSNHSSNVLANTTLLSSNVVASGRDCPPMNVTYRLQGLDGEATEPMIKELEEDREESQDPEVEFAIAGAVREYGGLEIILSMIQHLIDDFKSNQEQLVAVLNLLMLCCKIRENRRALLRQGGLGLLLETARRAFSVDAMEPAEGILLIVESLALEANESDNISITQSSLTTSSEETDKQAKKIVLMFLERLSHPLGLKKSSKQQRNTEMVARILPYLTYDEPAAMEALIQHFSPYLQEWSKFDVLQKQHEDNPKDESIAQKAAKERFTLENFVRVSESLKTSSCGERLKDIILERGITGIAVRHLRDSFAVTKQAGFKSNPEWASGLKLPSVPLILSMLRGLCTGHLATQNCIDEGGILPILHALEGASVDNQIGARAENLLDTLSNKEGKGDGFLEEKVRSLRNATRDEMRRLALRKREKMLLEFGMHQEQALDGGERIVVSRSLLEELEEIEEEEDGLACMVCREGYSLRPADLLGVYSYSKRVNLGAGGSGSARGDCVYTTVSYFNIIHFQCHQDAKRADAALKVSKKEWEGATLRNNESLCNSLFPVRGPSVPLSHYVRYVDHYWDNLTALGRADGSRLRLLTYDIVLMLARFATGASFSAESRGGGRESNSRFLPFMIQMACHLLEQGSSSQRRTMAKSVSAYISSESRSPTPGTLAGAEETVQFMMVNSLLSEPYPSWLNHRRAFLQRGIFHAHSAKSEPEPPTTGDLLPVVRPMLVYTGLIEQLQRFFKVKRSPDPALAPSTSSVPEDGGDEGGSRPEGWEVAMKERLVNMKEMAGLSKELVTWLEEMGTATDLQEAFDVAGLLADALAGGVASCEEFVRSAIGAGKT